MTTWPPHGQARQRNRWQRCPTSHTTPGHTACRRPSTEPHPNQI